MGLLANLLVGLVAIIQIAIGVVEMFLWAQPAVYGRLKPKVNLTQDEARKVAPIVANAGLYNWFLAAGLVWSLLLSGDFSAMRMFLLGCVAVAGVYGALTLKWTTLALQSFPALLALLAVWLSRAA